MREQLAWTAMSIDRENHRQAAHHQRRPTDEPMTERFPGARVPEGTLLRGGVGGFEW